MLKKLIISAATAATLVLGSGVMTAAPAAAQVFFGFGGGNGFYPGYDYGDGFYPGYGYDDDFNPGYGYGYRWHRHHHHWRDVPVRCFIRTVRWHHHWVNRRICRPVYY